MSERRKAKDAVQALPAQAVGQAVGYTVGMCRILHNCVLCTT